MKLVIDRKTWQRGKNEFNDTALLNQRGTMCCLGFLSLACGIPDAAIKDEGELNQLNDLRGWDSEEGRYMLDVEKVPINPLEFQRVYKHEHDFIEINDSYNLPETERENNLKNLFAEDGVEVEFVN